VAACLITLIGCGKGNPGAAAPQATTARGAAPAPTTPGGQGRTPSASAQDAFAAAVNLKPSDVPGFRASSRAKQATTPAEEQLVRELGKCAGGLGGALGSGDRSSPQFQRHVNVLQIGVSSGVSFLGSAAGGVAQLAVLRSPRTRGCLGHYLQRLLESQHYGAAKVTHVQVTQGSPPAAGTAGGFGWRLTADFTLHGLNVPFYLDILGFVYQRSEVTLTSSGEVFPFPATIEEQLFELLLSRARSHRI
jgi:hypothetical protein